MKISGHFFSKRLAVFAAVLAVVVAVRPTKAQVPDTLRHSIAAPPVGAQSAEQLGFSVAVDGNYTVAGAPYDEFGGRDSGVVKVFDSNTGALLHVIPNPSPEEEDLFGYSVSISGTRVVVGAYQDDTGAVDAGSAHGGWIGAEQQPGVGDSGLATARVLHGVDGGAEQRKQGSGSWKSRIEGRKEIFESRISNQ